jgi:hypothetical protein
MIARDAGRVGTIRLYGGVTNFPTVQAAQHICAGLWLCRQDAARSPEPPRFQPPHLWCRRASQDRLSRFSPILCVRQSARLRRCLHRLFARARPSTEQSRSSARGGKSDMSPCLGLLLASVVALATMRPAAQWNALFSFHSKECTSGRGGKGEPRWKAIACRVPFHARRLVQVAA